MSRIIAAEAGRDAGAGWLAYTISVILLHIASTNSMKYHPKVMEFLTYIHKMINFTLINMLKSSDLSGDISWGIFIFLLSSPYLWDFSKRFDNGYGLARHALWLAQFFFVPTLHEDRGNILPI